MDLKLLFPASVTSVTPYIKSFGSISERKETWKKRGVRKE
jgi:hypothetical protein